jgi:hypothetical protein
MYCECCGRRMPYADECREAVLCLRCEQEVVDLAEGDAFEVLTLPLFWRDLVLWYSRAKIDVYASPGAGKANRESLPIGEFWGGH